MKRHTRKLVTGLMTAALTLTAGITGSSAATAADPVLTASPAGDWTALLNRSGTSNGWQGADGIYSTPLDEARTFGGATSADRTFFIFSDTILGSSDAAGNVSGLAYQNHSSAVLRGNTPSPGNMAFKYGYRADMSTGQWDNLFGYTAWMQGGLTVGGTVYTFGIPFDSDWKPQQVDLISVPVADGEPDYTRFTRTSAVSQLHRRTTDFLYDYGIGTLNNSRQAGAPNPDGYIYLYGYRDALTGDRANTKDLIVSRVARSEFPNLGNIRYWNGNGWSATLTDSAPLIGDVSTEASVTPVTSGPYAGKYIAVYTRNVQSPDMMYAIGDSPVGPFSAPVRFYSAPEYEGAGNGQRYTYNAKAHPALSDSGELLVSYNVNRMGGASNANDYRPRFLSLDLGAGTTTANVALNKPASASSTDDPASRTARMAFDGNPATRWSSAYSDPQWIEVDLGGTFTVSGARLNWETAYGRGYRVQVSGDRTHWTTVHTTTAGDGGTDTLSFPGVNARYVRLYGTQRGTGWGYSLWDFEVQGRPA
ncbi:discoidin domain-containing protein [Streptomyces sp. NPDC049881]|uniref:galactose-binding domain-containing protein n=1 Tax=Streptomyces sp. NPDC049881 TaxID=3155778 RepID=UPI0034278C6A